MFVVRLILVELKETFCCIFFGCVLQVDCWVVILISGSFFVLNCHYCCFFVDCLRFVDYCWVLEYALILLVVTFTFKSGFVLL